MCGRGADRKFKGSFWVPHAMPREESDLSFAEFGGDAKRRHTALEIESEIGDPPNYLETMARREGLEPPTLRFEA